MGPNGAGKSTLLSMLSGQRTPRAGRVLMAGQPVHRLPVLELARQVAVLAQDTTVAFGFTVQEVVEIGCYPHRHAPSPHEARIVREAMQATGVAHLAGQSVNTLSGGERARSHLARALAQVWEPLPGGAARWLLLDEPAAAVQCTPVRSADGVGQLLMTAPGPCGRVMPALAGVPVVPARAPCRQMQMQFLAILASSACIDCLCCYKNSSKQRSAKSRRESR
jgi:ABC-type cobalamin transport system ATPase subunit